MAQQTVEAWLAAQAPQVLAMIEPLRAAVLTADRTVTEHIKWNGPSFCVGGDDRITLGLNPKGGVRAILHRGVRAREVADFAFSDDSGLIQWAAPDRGVISFADAEAVAAQGEAFTALCRRWLDATRP